MKAPISLILCLCIFILGQAQQQSQAKVESILAPDRFDQWGELSLADEQVHLDKIAKQAKEWSMSVVHLVIHAGQRACAGEAKARGIRAKDYLVKQGIAPERIEWVDAGWRKDLLIEVWIWPPQLGKPKVSSESNLKRDQVTIERNCKTKYRGR